MKRILYTVLDWGLGHATRSIPVIKALLKRDCEVIIASDSKALEFLRHEFPDLPSHELRPYNVEYSSSNILVNVARNSARIYKAMVDEQRLVQSLAQENKVELVITDNRYGSHARGIPNVIISHQLQFRTGSGLMDAVARARVRKWLDRFDYIWIPDDPSHTLSGELSHTNDPRKRYIGWLSTVSQLSVPRSFDLAVILSGPEPQRTMLEEKVMAQLSGLNLKAVVARGLPGSTEPRQSGSLTIYDFADRDMINKLIAGSSIILCRSGYSSLMDLQVTGSRAILTPTPGQPEQVYLAERMSRLSQYVTQDQNHLDILAGLNTLRQRQAPPPDPHSTKLLNTAIDEVLA